MTIYCPACGSTEFDSNQATKSAIIPYSSPAIWTEIINTCRNCHESGDFSEKNDELVMFAINEATKRSINQIIDDLNKMNIKSAYFERALDLPARTLAKWKSGSYSAAALALLRIVRTYPWLLEVADSNFDSKSAHRIVSQEIVKVFLNAVNQTPDKRIRFTAINKQNIAEITAEIVTSSVKSSKDIQFKPFKIAETTHAIT